MSIQRLIPSRLAVLATAAAGILAAVPAFGQTVFTSGAAEVRAFAATTSTRVFAAAYGGGLYVSNNAGDSWTRVALPGNARYVTSLALGPSYLLIGAEEGLFRTTDLTGGTGATQLLSEPVAAVAANGTTALAAIKGFGLMRSTNSGASFVSANNSGFDSTDFTAVAFHPSNANVAYASTMPDRTGAMGGVFRSADGGNTWASINTGLPDRHVTSIAVDSNDRVYAGVLSNGGGDVYYRNAGGSFTASTNFFGGVISVTRDANSATQMWASSKTLGLKSNPGGAGNGFQQQFGQTSTVVPGQPDPTPFFTAVNAVATFPGATAPVLKAIKGAGVWKSSALANPRTWTRVNFPGADRVRAATGVSGGGTSIMLMGLHAGGVWRSDNSGGTWNPPTVSPSRADFSDGAVFHQVNPFRTIWELSASATNANVIYAATGAVGMFYGNDNPGVFRYNGAAWQQVRNGGSEPAPWNIASEPGLIDGAQVFGVTVNRSNDQMVWASYLNSGVRRRDSAPTWSARPTVGATRGVVQSSTPTKLLALTYGDKPYISTDSGTSWNLVTVSQTGFEFLRFFSAAEDPVTTSRWVAGTNKGIFVSNDGGASFSRIPMANGIFQEVAILAVGFKPGTSTVFAADYDGNRYCSNVGGVAGSWKSAGAALNAGVNGIRTIGTALFYLTDGAGMVREDGTCP